MNEAGGAHAASLRIGDVARLTKLSIHTLRKWESRYHAVTPARTERGQRIYTRSEVERLLKIKKMVDAGVAPRIAARAGSK
jgi:DNA-binding transcriptional MerR regulator